MQIILVIVVLAIAVSYIGWEIYKRFFAKETKCESCGIGKTIKESKLGQ